MALELEVTVLVVAGDELEGEPADHVADFVLGAVVVLGAGGGEGGGEGGAGQRGGGGGLGVTVGDFYAGGLGVFEVLF